MKFLLVSDNHGQKEPLITLKKRYPAMDAYFHLGDSELSPEELSGYTAVTGNNDYYYDYPNALIVTVKGVKVLLMHSHQFFPNKRIEKLVAQAKQDQCDIVCFGHTHIPYEAVVDGVLVLNPGSLSYNRDGSPVSYMTVTFNDITDYQVTLHRYQSE